MSSPTQARRVRGCWIFGGLNLRGIHNPAAIWMRLSPIRMDEKRHLAVNINYLIHVVTIKTECEIKDGLTAPPHRLAPDCRVFALNAIDQPRILRIQDAGLPLAGRAFSRTGHKLARLPGLKRHHRVIQRPSAWHSGIPLHEEHLHLNH